MPRIPTCSTPNQTIKLRPSAGSQIPNTASSGVCQWYRLPSLGTSPRGSRAIFIAILDTGIDSKHQDLASEVIVSVYLSSSPSANDIYGHGTYVAGIAGASTNNGQGVASLGYNSTLMNVKVLDNDGSGGYSAVAAGMVWAADNGASVIDMSLEHEPGRERSGLPSEDCGELCLCSIAASGGYASGLSKASSRAASARFIWVRTYSEPRSTARGLISKALRSRHSM